MKAEDFRGWIDHMGWSERKVAAELQMSRTTVSKYKREGAPAFIGLACSAVAQGLPAWKVVTNPTAETQR